MKYSKRQKTTYESKVRNISNKLVAAIQGSDFLSEPFPTGKCEVSIAQKPNHLPLLTLSSSLHLHKASSEERVNKRTQHAHT